jgi:hypothetical protein
MSNWIDVTLDVLATSPDEINKIEVALQKPCEKLLKWVAQRWEDNPNEIAADVKELVSFDPKSNLGSASKARRFENSFKDRYSGVVWSHVDLVSRDFPEAIFLAEHWNLQASSAGRTVIRAGEEIRYVHDGSQRAQGYEWVLPNIFAPYWTEYDLGLGFGSLWDQWLSEAQSELASMKDYYGSTKLIGLQGKDSIDGPAEVNKADDADVGEYPEMPPTELEAE